MAGGDACFYPSADRPTSSNGLQALFFASCHVAHQGRFYSQDEAEGSVDDPLCRLPDAMLSSRLFSGMKIGSWCLPKQTSPIIQEGVVTLVPRVVVEPESVSPGKEFSGIFRIVSTFKGPNGSWKYEGTAFAVGKFHVLTAGHMMWHQKLGPAQSAVLYADTRSGTITEGIECVAVAVHAEWIKCYQPENDFCMIAIAQGFNSEIRLLQLGVAPSYPNVGRLLGFPSDLSVTSQGNELIECQGPVRSRQNNAGIILIHKVNTSGGSSGSPFFVEGKVVAVHSSFNRNKMENYAVPIGQNGNNVAQLQNVLRYMTCRGLKLSDAALYLGEVTYEDYCKQEILGFGSLAASGSWIPYLNYKGK